MRHIFCRFFIHNWIKWSKSHQFNNSTAEYQNRYCKWCNKEQSIVSIIHSYFGPH